jgi:hypothetical protein
MHGSLDGGSIQLNLGNAETDVVFLRPVNGAMRKHGCEAVQRRITSPVLPKLNYCLRAHRGRGDSEPESSVDICFLGLLVCLYSLKSQGFRPQPFMGRMRL